LTTSIPVRHTPGTDATRAERGNARQEISRWSPASRPAGNDRFGAGGWAVRMTRSRRQEPVNRDSRAMAAPANPKATVASGRIRVRRYSANRATTRHVCAPAHW